MNQFFGLSDVEGNGHGHGHGQSSIVSSDSYGTQLPLPFDPTGGTDDVSGGDVSGGDPVDGSTGRVAPSSSHSSSSFSHSAEALDIAVEREGQWQQYILVRMGGYGYDRDRERVIRIVEKELRLQFGSMVQLVVGLVVTLEDPDAPTVDGSVDGDVPPRSPQL